MVRKKDLKKVTEQKRKSRENDGEKGKSHEEKAKEKEERRKAQAWIGGTDHTENLKPGCNTPTGCLLGQPIPAGARAPPAGAVCVRCSNDSCPAVPWLHDKCYEKWEKSLIRLMTSHQGKARSLNEREARRILWATKFYDLIHSGCHCPAGGCAGKLHREVCEEKMVIAAAQAKRQKVQKQIPVAAQSTGACGRSKAHKDLPKLARPADYGYLKSCSGANASSATRGFIPHREQGCVQRSQYPQGQSSGLNGGYGFSSYRDKDAYGAHSREETENWNASSNFRIDDSESWPTLPGACESEESSVQLDTEDPCDSDRSYASNLIPDDSTGVTKETFLRDLETLVRVHDGRLMEDHKVVQDEFSKCGISLMSEMCDFGGFAQWLSLNSEKMCVIRGEILLKAQDQFSQLNGVGEVRQPLRFCDATRSLYGIVLCNDVYAGQVGVLFDSNTQFTDGCNDHGKGDKVSFLAMKVDNPMPKLNCEWYVIEMVLLERAPIQPSFQLAPEVAGGTPNCVDEPVPVEHAPLPTYDQPPPMPPAYGQPPPQIQMRMNSREIRAKYFPCPARETEEDRPNVFPHRGTRAFHGFGSIPVDSGVWCFSPPARTTATEGVGGYLAESREELNRSFRRLFLSKNLAGDRELQDFKLEDSDWKIVKQKTKPPPKKIPSLFDWQPKFGESNKGFNEDGKPQFNDNYNVPYGSGMVGKCADVRNEYTRASNLPTMAELLGSVRKKENQNLFAAERGEEAIGRATSPLSDSVQSSVSSYHTASDDMAGGDSSRPQPSIVDTDSRPMVKSGEVDRPGPTTGQRLIPTARVVPHTAIASTNRESTGEEENSVLGSKCSDVTECGSGVTEVPENYAKQLEQHVNLGIERKEAIDFQSDDMSEWEKILESLK